MVLTETGLAKVFQRIKSFVIAQLNSKASAIHTHTKSEITDFPTNYVTTDTTQTISGAKTFTSTPTVKKDSAGDLLYLIDDTINTSNEDENGLPLTGHTNALKIRGRVTSVLPCMLTGAVYTSGDTSAELRTYKYKDISSTNGRVSLVLRYSYKNNYGFVSFSNISFITPNITNTSNIGSPSLQWKDTYTRHILIDNDINIASSMINKTSTSGNLAIRSGPYYADGASINLKGKDQTDDSGGRAYITANDGTNHTELVIYPTGETKLTTNSTTKNLALQEDINTLLSGKANTSHTHSVSDITSGTLDSARIPNLDASKITSGTIDIDRLPAGALERLVIVADQTARYALTTSSVQLGDTVKQLDTGIMYYVVDTSKLNSADGYSEYTAGSATSVPWSGVTNKPSSFTPSSHTHTTSDITDFPALSTVATSGSYDDLTNKPTIPTYSAGTNLSLNDTTFNVSSTPSFTSITVSGYTITVD